MKYQRVSLQELCDCRPVALFNLKMQVRCICGHVSNVDGMRYCPKCNAGIVVQNDGSGDNLALRPVVILPDGIHVPEGVVPVALGWVKK